MPDFARKLYRDRRGGTAIEYGLICALIVLAMVGALSQLAGITINMWDDVSSNVQSATN